MDPASIINFLSNDDTPPLCALCGGESHYTRWQHDLYAEMPVEDLYNKIKTYETEEMQRGINK
jgi:hypothetical protein